MYPQWLLSLRLRLLGAFALTSLLTLLLGLFATDGVRKSGAAVVSVFGHALMATSYARSAAAEFASMDAAAAHAYAAKDEAERAQQEQRGQDVAALVFQDLSIAEERAATPASREAARRAAKAVRDWQAAYQGSESRQPALLATLADKANDEIDILVNTVAGDAFRQKQAAEASIADITVQTGVSTVLATLFGLLAAFGLARQLLGPVKAASESATAIAAGHLDTVVPRGGSDELGRLLTAMSTMRDSIRATIAAETAGRLDAQKRLMDTMEGSTEGVVLIDAAGQVSAANARALELLAEGREQLMPGGSWHGVLEASLDAQAAAEAASSAQPVVLERKQADGSWLRLSCSPARSGGGTVAVISNITSLKQKEEELAYIALHDPLTQLPNRANFLSSLDAALTSPDPAESAVCAPFALLNLDLRHFRGLNEGSGSAVGDAILEQAAARLSVCAGETGIVARLGGDEFAILQLGTERAEDVGLLARRIIEALRIPFTVGGEGFSIGIDIGIALGPADATTPERLLQFADTALSRAKQEAGSSVRFFAPEMDKRLADRRQAEADLETAIREEQLVVYYQPLVDLASGRVSSFEALIRWNHPERGMVPPGLFIPLAEQTGLIGAIGDWVLARACHDAARWPSNIKVGINVSPLQFGNPALVETVRRALASSGLRPSRLELEITESVLLKDGSGTMAALRQFNELGIGIAIDDFGTGYSSLSTLRSFPFHKIKIDKSFIDDLAKTEDARVIVNAIVGLGRNLKMRTTAEGVECEDQLANLRAAGCAEIQGYYFGRPGPNADVLPTIERIRAMLAEDVPVAV